MAQIQFNSAFQTNNAVLQENNLTTIGHQLDHATSYLFVGLPVDAASFSGNNAIGVLYSYDATGNVIGEYKGEISRQYKLPGNQVEAFQFYVYPEKGGGNYNKLPSATILLDVGNEALTPNTDYKTSSDFKPANLDAFISKAPVIDPINIPTDATDNPLDPPGPLDQGWNPGGPDTTPDPTNGKVDVVDPPPSDKPINTNNSELPPKEVVDLNTGDGEKHTLDIKDPTTPDHKPPPNTTIDVSTDGGETWEEHKPGDEITTGEKDVLVVVDTHEKPNPDGQPTHDLELVVDSGTDKEVDTGITPVDPNAPPTPGGPDTTPDPAKGVIEVVPQKPANEGSPDTITQLNTNEGEKLTFEVDNKAPPGEKPTNLNNPDIFVSTDNGHTWGHVDPGKEITAGKDDVLVAVDISKNPDKGTGNTETFTLVVNPGKPNEVDIPVQIIDNGSGIITHQISEATTNYSGHDVLNAPRDSHTPLVGQIVYDDHGSVCIL